METAIAPIATSSAHTATTNAPPATPALDFGGLAFGAAGRATGLAGALAGAAAFAGAVAGGVGAAGCGGTTGVGAVVVAGDSWGGSGAFAVISRLLRTALWIDRSGSGQPAQSE